MKLCTVALFPSTAQGRHGGDRGRGHGRWTGGRPLKPGQRCGRQTAMAHRETDDNIVGWGPKKTLWRGLTGQTWQGPRLG